MCATVHKSASWWGACGVPAERQTTASHVGLAGKGKQAKLARARTAEAATVYPAFHLVVVCEAAVHLDQFSHADQGGVGVFVIAIPHGSVGGGGKVLEAVNDHLDGSGSVRDEDQVVIVGICAEEA